MRFCLLNIWLILFSVSLFAQNRDTIPNIVLVVIDGPRMTESFGDSTYRNVPNLYRLFSQQGAILPNFRNNGVTATCPGHTALTTGVYQKIDNSGRELPNKPSVFQYWLKTSEADRNKAWIVTSKGKLEVLANTKDNNWHDAYLPGNSCGAGRGVKRNDPATIAKAKELIQMHQPKLLLVQLMEPDISGHRNDWEAYIQGLKQSDSLAADLWYFLQKQEAYKNNTIMLVTNDHGRHTKHFAHHGDGCNGCREIFLLAIGPSIPKGKIISTSYEQIDVPTTIASWLDIAMPTSEGRVIDFNE